MKDLSLFPLWTAVVTPMNEDTSVDYDSFERILREQEEANNGVVILGSTGEALNLDRDEARKVLEFGLSLKLNIPVMTGIGGYNLKECLNYVEYLNSLNGLDAYLVVTPIYAKPGEHGQTHWFKSIMDKSTRPCMLYNVPSRAGVKMNFNAIKNLKDHPNFWAIKEASGDPNDFAKYQEAAPRARMYSGDDGMMYDFVPHGCVGLVSVASNAWPKETRAYTVKAVAKKLSAEEAKMWSAACDTLFIAANPVPVKNIMNYNQQIKTNVLRAPLNHMDLADNSPVIEAQNKVKNWYKENH